MEEDTHQPLGVIHRSQDIHRPVECHSQDIHRSLATPRQVAVAAA